jgi:hypothetical protein
VLQQPAVHYEALLGHIETQMRRPRALQQEYHGLYSWLVEMVYMMLYFRHLSSAKFFNTSLSWYDGLKALSDQDAPLWIFSLNHDLIVELLAARLSIRLHTGFSPQKITLPRRDSNGKKKGEIEAEVLAGAELEQHAMRFPNPFQSGIYLIKIHGALDIFYIQRWKGFVEIAAAYRRLERVY